MNQWLSKTGFEFSRSKGVHIHDIGSDVYDRDMRLRLYGFDLTVSEIGCFLAHRNCWKEVVDKGRHSLILESDVEPSTDCSELVSQILSGVANCVEDFDLVRLHGIFQQNEIVCRTVRPLTKGTKLVQSLGDPMGAGAYIISPAAANRLLQLTESIWCPVDVFLSLTWLHKLRFRTVKPYPFKVFPFPSEIGEDRRRPKQSYLTRFQIEKNRLSRDLRRLAYMPKHFLG